MADKEGVSAESTGNTKEDWDIFFILCGGDRKVSLNINS